MKIDLDKLWEPEAYEQSYPPGYSPSLTGKLVLTTDKIEPLPAQDISMNILDDLAYFEQKINKALYGLRAPSVQEEWAHHLLPAIITYGLAVAIVKWQISSSKT